MNNIKSLVILALIFCSSFGISQCNTFNDISNSNEIEEAYSIFRNHFTQNRFKDALPYWEKVYQSSPTLDGTKNYVYKYGIELFTHKLEKETIKKNKVKLAEFILRLHSEHKSCFPDKQIEPISPEIRKLLDVKSRHSN